MSSRGDGVQFYTRGISVYVIGADMFEKSLRKLWCWVRRYLDVSAGRRQTHKGGNILGIYEGHQR